MQRRIYLAATFGVTAGSVGCPTPWLGGSVGGEMRPESRIEQTEWTEPPAPQRMLSDVQTIVGGTT